MTRANGRASSTFTRPGRYVGVAGLAVLVGISIAYVDSPDAEPDPDTAIEAFVDGAPEPITETPDPPPADVGPGPPEHEPGTMYPADEGAWEWDDLNDDEKAGAEHAQEWAETANGTEVHNAFSAAVATTTTLRRVDDAQLAVGLDGVESLGVVP